MPDLQKASHLPADGSARPHQSMPWAKVAGEWLESYKQIAQRLCDRWQAPQPQERSTGQIFTALQHTFRNDWCYSIK